MTIPPKPGPPGDRPKARPKRPSWDPPLPGELPSRQPLSRTRIKPPEADAPAAEPGPPAVQATRIDIGRRGVSLIIDVAAAYFVAVMVSMIPFISQFLPLYATMIAFLLCRDFLFEGRGIGKNLMGLQVVDIASGRPPDILQSVQRNIILVAPFVVLEAISLTQKFIPIAFLNQIVSNLVNLIGMIYCGFVIPLEVYRVYSRADSRRIGDEIAGTAIIESNMDFSNIVPKEH